MVGYQNKAVRQFLSQQVCTFDQIGVSGGALDIQKLLPVDGEGNYIGDGAVNIQFYSNLGAIQGQYAYYGKDEYDDDTPAGWYDESEDELRVRLIGIDAPESANEDEEKNTEEGITATEYTRSILLNKDVFLEYDKELIDKYGRTLAYIWVDGNLFKGKSLI